MKRIITIIITITLYSISQNTQSQIVITNNNVFNTADQMLLANELFDSGEPFAEALGYNLDNLDPMIPNSPDQLAYATGIENYEYSRYLLNTLNGRSGMGLHMMWSPIIMENAAMQPASFDGMFTGGTPNGFKEDDMLMRMIQSFGMNANFTPFANPFPQFADFVSGDTNLPQTVQSDFLNNFASTRWNRSLMDKTLNLGAMGQSASKQYLWAQDMLSAFHDGNDAEVIPNGTNSPDLPNSPNFDPNNNIFYGGNNVDGFIGQILTAESVNKTKFILTQLAYDGTTLGGVNPATYNPANGIKYFPTKIAVTEAPVLAGLPPKATTFTVTDPMSKLFDQYSYLLATASYRNMMDPNNNSDAAHLAYHEVFDGFPFPANMATTGTPGPYDLMSGASKVLFLNMMAMHYNTTENTFVDDSMLNNSGMPVKGTTITTVNAGYVIVTLAKFAQEFLGTPLETAANNALTAQANYIIANLKDATGGYYNAYTIGTGADTTTKTLATNAAIIRGLYAAYNATNNASYLNEANANYNYIIANYYIPTEKVFRTEEANDTATYTPWNLAILSGAMREASITGNIITAANTYKDVFDKIYNKMILSEAEATGEDGTGSDNDGIPYIVGGTKPFVFAAEATYTITTASVENINLGITKVTIYPNPTKSKINITLEINKPARVNIDIVDVNGRIIYTVSQNKLEAGTQYIKIPITNIESGIYFIKIKTDKGIFTTKKIVKI